MNHTKIANKKKNLILYTCFYKLHHKQHPVKEQMSCSVLFKYVKRIYEDDEISSIPMFIPPLDKVKLL